MRRSGVVAGLLVALLTLHAESQTAANERSFPQSKAAIEKTLKAMQGSMAGHLPVLEGFAQPGAHSLDQYQRGYYQAIAGVRSTSTGGSIVKINTKVTAWYSGPERAHSGYELLTSNGRIESDLLDQLAEQLAKAGSAESATVSAAVAKPAQSSATDSTPSAPTPSSKFPNTPPYSSSLGQTAAPPESAGSASSSASASSEDANSRLRAEAVSLEEILKNQAHPKNLVAVKKSGTPVVATPSLTAKPEFLASMHDEFELLNFTADWVHVRISGLSRGWIWRNSVEMPDGVANIDTPTASALTPVTDLFRVTREEAAPFPGDWEPLRSKNVKIISVQKVDENAKETGPGDRLEYAKFLLEKNYKDLSQRPSELAGVVVIFDSADGGMIAATLPTLQQWRAGTLSDSALWHKCFFDPPETFESSATAGSQ